MLEVLIFAVAVTAATPAPQKQQRTAQAPAAELLEFIGDWSEDEAHQFLDTRNKGEKPLPALGGSGPTETKDVRHER
ncbi:MAG: hypothetical protein ACRETW_03340 [Stenotrophobium sp.]